MGTAKRERQKANTRSRRAEAEAQAKKLRRKRNYTRYALYAGAVVLAGVVFWLFNRDGGDDNVATTDSSTTTPSATVTTPDGSVATGVTVAPVTSAFAYGTTDCPPAGNTERKATFSAPFKQCIDVTKTYTAIVKTNKGELKIKLDPTKAPGAVNNFVALAQYKYFDAVPCHRIIPNFVVQCGDPTGTGTGGPGYKFADELPAAGQYKVGSIAMANSGPNTNGSQFFFISGSQGAALPPSYSFFGQITEGLDTTLKTLDAAGTPAGVPTKEPITLESVRIEVS